MSHSHEKLTNFAESALNPVEPSPHRPPPFVSRRPRGHCGHRSAHTLRLRPDDVPSDQGQAQRSPVHRARRRGDLVLTDHTGALIPLPAGKVDRPVPLWRVEAEAVLRRQPQGDRVRRDAGAPARHARPVHAALVDGDVDSVVRADLLHLRPNRGGTGGAAESPDAGGPGRPATDAGRHPGTRRRREDGAVAHGDAPARRARSLGRPTRDRGVALDQPQGRRPTPRAGGRRYAGRPARAQRPRPASPTPHSSSTSRGRNSARATPPRRPG